MFQSPRKRGRSRDIIETRKESKCLTRVSIPSEAGPVARPGDRPRLPRRRSSRFNPLGSGAGRATKRPRLPLISSGQGVSIPSEAGPVARHIEQIEDQARAEAGFNPLGSGAGRATPRRDRRRRQRDRSFQSPRKRGRSRDERKLGCLERKVKKWFQSPRKRGRSRDLKWRVKRSLPEYNVSIPSEAGPVARRTLRISKIFRVDASQFVVTGLLSCHPSGSALLEALCCHSNTLSKQRLVRLS